MSQASPAGRCPCTTPTTNPWNVESPSIGFALRGRQADHIEGLVRSITGLVCNVQLVLDVGNCFIHQNAILLLRHMQVMSSVTVNAHYVAEDAHTNRRVSWLHVVLSCLKMPSELEQSGLLIIWSPTIKASSTLLLLRTITLRTLNSNKDTVAFLTRTCHAWFVCWENCCHDFRTRGFKTLLLHPLGTKNTGCTL